MEAGRHWALAYENFGSSVWKTGQYIAEDGRTFDAAEYPMKMQNFMLELTHNYHSTMTTLFLPSPELASL